MYLQQIKEILISTDLMGLIKMGCLNDEYDHEAEYLSMAITKKSSIKFIQKTLWNVFYNSFCSSCGFEIVKGKSIPCDENFMTIKEANKFIGPINKYEAAARKIQAILKNTTP